jgi:hypothetical protein
LKDLGHEVAQVLPLRYNPFEQDVQFLGEIVQLEHTSSHFLQNTIEAYVPIEQLSVQVLLSDEKYMKVGSVVLQKP